MNAIIAIAIIPIFYLIMNLTLNQTEVAYYLDMDDTGMSRYMETNDEEGWD